MSDWLVVAILAGCVVAVLLLWAFSGEDDGD